MCGAVSVWKTPSTVHVCVCACVDRFTIIAERLSARLLIVQRSQFAFVCMYVCISVTLYCGLVPILLATWYWFDQEAIEIVRVRER